MISYGICVGFTHGTWWLMRILQQKKWDFVGVVPRNWHLTRRNTSPGPASWFGMWNKQSDAVMEDFSTFHGHRDLTELFVGALIRTIYGVVWWGFCQQQHGILKSQGFPIFSWFLGVVSFFFVVNGWSIALTKATPSPSDVLVLPVRLRAASTQHRLQTEAGDHGECWVHIRQETHS